MSSYRYDRLMEVKEKLLEHKQMEMERIAGAIIEVDKEMGRTEDEMAHTYKEMTCRCITGMELGVLMGNVAFLDQKKARLLDERRQREMALETLRTDLANLEIELRMLEKLKSKTMAAVKKEQNRKEQNLMDELALRIEPR
jgi:flagellar export protein FliJ